jgi:hypothetical protein
MAKNYPPPAAGNTTKMQLGMIMPDSQEDLFILFEKKKICVAKWRKE